MNKCRFLASCERLTLEYADYLNNITDDTMTNRRSPWWNHGAYPKGMSFAEMFDWHLSYWGTKAQCSLEHRNSCESMGYLAAIFHEGTPNRKPGNSERKLHQWRKGEHPPSDGTVVGNIFRFLFEGDERLDDWKADLYDALEKARANEPDLPSDASLESPVQDLMHSRSMTQGADISAQRAHEATSLSSPFGAALRSHFDSPPCKSNRLGTSDVWTVKLFASAVGVSDFAVRQWLRGDSLPTAHRMPLIISELFGPERDRFENEMNELWRLLRQHEGVGIETPDSSPQSNPATGAIKEEMPNPATSWRGVRGEYFSDTPQTAENIAKEAAKKDRESNIEIVNELRLENENLRREIKILNKKFNEKLNEENVLDSSSEIRCIVKWSNEPKERSQLKFVKSREIFFYICPVLFSGESIEMIQYHIACFTELSNNKGFINKKCEIISMDEATVQKFLIKMVGIGYIDMSVNDDSRYYKYNTEYKITEKGLALWAKSSR